MSVVIYHNPRCSKSRQTLEIIKETNVKHEVVEYLQHPPSTSELDRILHLLGLEPAELLRKGESIYKELGLKEKTLSRQQWIETMTANPILIERPIVVHGDKAVIGRPPEKVLDILPASH